MSSVLRDCELCGCRLRLGHEVQRVAPRHHRERGHEFDAVNVRVSGERDIAIRAVEYGYIGHFAQPLLELAQVELAVRELRIKG